MAGGTLPTEDAWYSVSAPLRDSGPCPMACRSLRGKRHTGHDHVVPAGARAKTFYLVHWGWFIGLWSHRGMKPSLGDA